MKVLFCFVAICLASVLATGLLDWGYGGYGAGWPVNTYAALPVVRTAGWGDAGYGVWDRYGDYPAFGYNDWGAWRKK